MVCGSLHGTFGSVDDAGGSRVVSLKRQGHGGANGLSWKPGDQDFELFTHHVNPVTNHNACHGCRHIEAVSNIS